MVVVGPRTNCDIMGFVTQLIVHFAHTRSELWITCFLDVSIVVKLGLDYVLQRFAASDATGGITIFRVVDGYPETSSQATTQTLVEREALVRSFSPGSTLEPGVKAFRRRGPKWLL
jgi:hypothetical protein